MFVKIEARVFVTYGLISPSPKKALDPNSPKLVPISQIPNVTVLGSKNVSCQAP